MKHHHYNAMASFFMCGQITRTLESFQKAEAEERMLSGKPSPKLDKGRVRKNIAHEKEYLMNMAGPDGNWTRGHE